MALICNLTGLWLVALLTAHSASVAGWSFCVRFLHIFFQLTCRLLCFSFRDPFEETTRSVPARLPHQGEPGRHLLRGSRAAQVPWELLPEVRLQLPSSPGKGHQPLGVVVYFLLQRPVSKGGRLAGPLLRQTSRECLCRRVVEAAAAILNVKLENYNLQSRHFWLLSWHRDRGFLFSFCIMN